MKLRTRLTIAFCTVLIGPVLLLTLILVIIGVRQIREVEDTFGIDFSFSYIFSPAQIITESTNEVWEEVHDLSVRDPDAFLDPQQAEAINKVLDERRSYLVVIHDGEMVYRGTEEDVSELSSLLPAYGMGERRGKPVYLGGRLRAVIRQQDIQFSDGSTGSAFIVTEYSSVTPSFRKVIFWIGICIIMVLLLNAMGLTLWIYHGISAPIARLRDATHRITDGDLDFTLSARGEDEISDLTKDFEIMRRRLKESEEEKARFDRDNQELISNISHDLKTPITSIKGYMEGIMDGVADTPEKMDRYIRTVYNKANDMDRLINELTFYSNIDAKRIPYHFTILNVTNFFNDCADDLSLELEEKGITFIYRNKAQPETCIIADPEQLRRVINNIVSNSEKYMDKPEGRIELRIVEAGDFVQVDLEDNGKGIEARELTSIFDRFYRTDAARSTSMGGSGIGLSIVRKIIEDHDGRIWATSKVGERTTLTFVIRIYRADPEKGETKNEQDINY